MASAKRHYQPIDSPVHPSVLDAVIHLLFSHLSKGLKEPIPTLGPQRFASFWVSAKVWNQETSSIRIVNEIRKASSVSTSIAVETDVYVLAEDGSPLGIFEDAALTEVARVQHQESDSSGHHLLYGIAWKPQLSTLGPQELQKMCNAAARTREENDGLSLYPKFELAMGEAARRALQTVTSGQLDHVPGFLRRYAASLQNQFGTDTPVKRQSLSDEAFESLLQQCEGESPARGLVPLIARNLGAILRAEIDSAELFSSADMDAGSALSQMFSHFAQDGRLSHFLDLASHKNPGLRILEVGAGNGAVTHQILTALQAFEAKTGQARFSEYTFTDIISTVFYSVRKELSSWQERMVFKVLDLEHGPTGQGFEASGYDMIVAANVVHATQNLKKTLGYLRGLLRPGGHLVLVEVVSPDSVLVNVGFGCLEGWWVAEEPEHQQSPIVTEERWDALMRETAFAGANMIIKDCQDPASHYSSIMIATALDPAKTEPRTNGHTNGETNGEGHCDQPEPFVLIDPVSDVQTSLATDPAKQHSGTQVVDVAQVIERNWAPPPSAIIISMLEVEQARVANLSEADFTTLKKALHGAQQIPWVISAPHTGDVVADPRYSGLLRTIRSEDTDKHVVMLRIEPSDHANRTKFVNEVLHLCFLDQPASAEAEFVARDGHLTIARLAREISLDEERESRIHAQLRTDEWQSGPPLALEVRAPGLVDTLRFREDLDHQADLGPEEVEIQAEAWLVSFRDIFIALGRLGREELGVECAGTVTRVGSACSSLQLGDRVVMVTPGCMRSHPRAPAETVMKIPDGLTSNEAVAVINPGTTAYHALVNVARLQAGEKILIHSAAGSTGQFAIGIAKMLGAEVFATVGYNDKKHLLMDRFGIPEDHIFYNRNTIFAQDIKRVIDGYGVDVVLNSLSGDGLRASWEYIAPFGRFVEIGKADIGANTPLPMSSFARNASFAAINL